VRYKERPLCTVSNVDAEIPVDIRREDMSPRNALAKHLTSVTL